MVKGLVLAWTGILACSTALALSPCVDVYRDAVVSHLDTEVDLTTDLLLAQWLEEKAMEARKSETSGGGGVRIFGNGFGGQYSASELDQLAHSLRTERKTEAKMQVYFKLSSKAPVTEALRLFNECLDKQSLRVTLTDLGDDLRATAIWQPRNAFEPDSVVVNQIYALNASVQAGGLGSDTVLQKGTERVSLLKRRSEAPVLVHVTLRKGSGAFAILPQRTSPCQSTLSFLLDKDLPRGSVSPPVGQSRLRVTKHDMLHGMERVEQVTAYFRQLQAEFGQRLPAGASREIKALLRADYTDNLLSNLRHARGPDVHGNYDLDPQARAFNQSLQLIRDALSACN